MSEFVKQLEDFIFTHIQDERRSTVPKVDVYLWNEERYGPRIAEISVYWPDKERGLPFGGGFSWMQSDPSAVLFAAERLLLAYMIGNNADGWPPDLIAEEEEGLRWAIEQETNAK